MTTVKIEISGEQGSGKTEFFRKIVSNAKLAGYVTTNAFASGRKQSEFMSNLENDEKKLEITVQDI